MDSEIQSAIWTLSYNQDLLMRLLPTFQKTLLMIMKFDNWIETLSPSEILEYANTIQKVSDNQWNPKEL